jgi:hypothetical protein
MNEGYIVINPGEDPLDYLENGYVYMRYKYIIEGPPLSTYHRDVTSSSTVFKTQHPTYTYLTYNYDGNFLSVSPGSHKTWTFEFPITLSGKRGGGVLFDCDLVHGGLRGPIGDSERVATQYKIVHYDDIPLLLHLDNVEVCKRSVVIPLWQEICMRITSYIFVVPIQWFAGSLLHRQYEGVLGFIQRLIPINHYNNYKDK